MMGSAHGRQLEMEMSTAPKREAYKRSAKALGIMEDFKSGVPRTAYRGIVSFMHSGVRVYLAPNLNWQGYDPKWA